MKLTKFQATRLRWNGDNRQGGFWWNLLWYLVLTVVTELLRPKPDIENAKPSGLGDFQFPTATEGRSVPVLWGTVKVKGPNVIWYGDLKVDPIIENVSTGLFSSEDITKGFKYYLGVQFALCRGPIDAINKVWAGEELIFDGSLTHQNSFSVDLPELWGGDELGNGGFAGAFQLFDGRLDQPVSPYLGTRRIGNPTIVATGSGYVIGDNLTVVGGTGTVAAVFKVILMDGVLLGNGLIGDIAYLALVNGGNYSEFPTSPAATTGGAGTGATVAFTIIPGKQITVANGRTPAYRGTAYVAPAGESITNPHTGGRIYTGNSSSIKPMAWEVKRIPNGLSLASGGVVNSLDANPMNVIYEVLTDTIWGLGIPVAAIDTVGFAAAGLVLASEGNGFSYIMDRQMSATEVINLVEEQIDGVLFFNQGTEKYEVKLARGDYTPATLPELNSGNILKVNSFSRGSWEDTTNTVRSQFFDRSDDYKQTYGLAQDSGNIRIQGGLSIVATKVYPGCKNADLANQLAWRDLRGLSYPLARLSLTVDRSFWDTNTGDVFAWTSAKLGLTRLPVRVLRVDFGDPNDQKVKLELVQDIFYFQAGTFAPPGGTGWEPPSDTLVPFDTTRTILLEAPRALVSRSPGSTSSTDPLVWLSARRAGVEVTYKVHTKLSSQPQGDYSVVAESPGFVLIGRLANTLSTDGVTPSGSMLVAPTPDLLESITPLFDSSPSLPQLGTDLLGLILIGNEFMLVQDASVSGTFANLQNVYRGVLDSVRETHTSGSLVWLMTAGGVAVGSFGESEVRNFRLQPRSQSDIVLLSSTVEETVTLDKRTRRPYPPGEFTVNGTVWPTSRGLAISGVGEAIGMLMGWKRRDYRTADGADEIAALVSDAQTIFPDFPAVNTNTNNLEVWNDPEGTPALLLSFSGLTAVSQQVTQLSVLQATGGVLPTRLRARIETQHTDNGEVLTAKYTLQHDFDVTSPLTGYMEFGSLLANVASAQYTADAAATHSFVMTSVFSVGSLEYRLDAGAGFGAWTTLIAAGNLVGSIAGVLVGDIIEVRHTSTDASALKLLTMTVPAGTSAFGVLETP